VAVGEGETSGLGDGLGLTPGLGDGLGDGLSSGDGEGEGDSSVIVKVRAVQAWGAAASGSDSGAVGATACCLNW